MPVERIEQFIADRTRGSFDALALEAFSFQRDRIEPYRALCQRQGLTTEPATWEQVPLVPTLAFKRLELCAGEPLETFRSSGTTAPQKSVHLHAYPELYRAAIDASFPYHALPLRSPPTEAEEATTSRIRVPMLSLIPDRAQAPDSSLSFMIDHVLARWGDPSSAYAIGPRGVEARELRAWLAARQRDGSPALVLTTALALLDALEALDRLGLRFRLPPGSMLFETGGYKGSRLEVAPEGLERRIQQLLGVPPGQIVREYGMTELTSQMYGRAADGRSAVFTAPHWVRVRILDPHSLETCAPGEVGMVAVFDLANVGSALHVLTEDLGAIVDGGLELHGRAQGSELRGCSLTAEELSSHRAAQ